MSTAVDYKELSESEAIQIEREIQGDMVDLFYKAAPTVITAGFFTSLNIFVFFYNITDRSLLIAWFLGFNLTTLLSTLLYIYYKKFKSKFEIYQWRFALAFLIGTYTVYYSASLLFNFPDQLHQFILMGILVMIAGAFSTTTVGMVKLCTFCVSLILIPVASWFFMQNEFYYTVSGTGVLIYYIFLLGMNFQSTDWLRKSLRLKLETAHFTHQANHDFLTGLPNQRGLIRLLDTKTEMAKKYSTKFAVICFSLNGLERFNNSLGYPAGDLIIQSLGDRLKTLERLQDAHSPHYIITLPRSDSFVILMTSVDEKDIENDVKKLFFSLDKPFHLGQREAKLSASVGVSIFPQDGDDPRILLSNAYASLFQAKQRGGNQVELYTKAINEKTPYLLELENDLHHALEKDQFMVFYQPLVDLQTGKIAGMEALIRWNHPTRGIVSPIDFIPLAEDTNLIIEIGKWVLEEAVRQTLEWHRRGFSSLSLRVAVNLSPKQLRQGNLLKTIEEVLADTGIDPKYLELELTETAILDQAVTPIIQEISRKGISLSIDDFGTGYSGLSYLKFFDIDKIKIDKSFIQDITTNPESATIVSAILAMAKELDIKTLAEGVETKEQLEFLKTRGCRYIQGFYYSKPVPAEEFTQLLSGQGNVT